MLAALDFNKLFKLEIDACDTGAGSVLQEDEDHIDQPVCLLSKK